MDNPEENDILIGEDQCKAHWNSAGKDLRLQAKGQKLPWCTKGKSQDIPSFQAWPITCATDFHNF